MTLHESLQIMLAELESHKLEVCLAPSKRWDRRDHDMIRVTLDRPPSWYRRLCNAHQSSRRVRRGKYDTRIKRANVIAILTRLVEQKQTTSKYRDELLAVARKEAGRG